MSIYGWVTGQPLPKKEFVRRTFRICNNEDDAGNDCGHPEFEHMSSGRCLRCGCKKFRPSLERYQYMDEDIVTYAPRKHPIHLKSLPEHAEGY